MNDYWNENKFQGLNIWFFLYNFVFKIQKEQLGISGSRLEPFKKPGPNKMPRSGSTTLAIRHTCSLWRIFWRRYHRTPCERPWRRCGRSQGSGSGCQWWCFRTVSCLLMYIYNQFRIRALRMFGSIFPKECIRFQF